MNFYLPCYIILDVVGLVNGVSGVSLDVKGVPTSEGTLEITDGR